MSPRTQDRPRTQERPVGDPAFADSDAITHEPVVEEERSELADPEDARNPVTWSVVGAVGALLALAIIAGVTAGWQFTLPFAVVAVLAVVFVAMHRAMGEANRRREDDPFPDVTFDRRA